jgi:protein involved in polysaccharide export with SLBB domain
VLALFLATQPVLWMSNVALAQTLAQHADTQAASRDALFPGRQGVPQPSQPGPLLTGEPDGARPDRQPGTVPGASPVDEPLDPDRYVMGPGDVLELHFWGIENFRLRVTVDLEGRAFVPKVGYLQLGGRTLAATNAEMRASVARYFPKLGFGMNLAEPRTFLVQVVDDVVRPGPQPAKGIDRVATVITRAGGLGPNASKRRIEVKRRDGSVLSADLLLYVLTGDVKHNPFVLDGDVVRVPFESHVVTVGGAVNRPGAYELVGTKDVAEVVDLAGGLSPLATRELPLTVIRRQADEKLKRLAFDFPSHGGLPTVSLASEDSVWVPSFGELQQSITITGALVGVAAAGSADGGGAGATATGGRGTVAQDEAAATKRLPYAEGDTVRSILERAGGTGPLADLKGSYILRRGQAISIDLYALVMLRDFTADRPVQLGDTIVVPFRRASILVEGAVFRPGPYPYSPTNGVEQYLALAGGLSRNAQGIDEVYVVTPSGEMRKYAPDLQIDPGSSLVVPERAFSRAEVVSLILAGAGLLLSAVTIGLTFRK